jgi:hypothetical protein
MFPQGQYTLLLDSVFFNHPREAIYIFDWLHGLRTANKLGTSKAFTRPKLVDWLISLVDNGKSLDDSIASKTVHYQNLYRKYHRLVRQEDKVLGQNRVKFNAVIQSPFFIPGYVTDLGSNSLSEYRAIIKDNEKMLLEWFGDFSKEEMVNVRKFVVIYRDSDYNAEQKEEWKSKWKHVSIFF